MTCRQAQILFLSAVQKGNTIQGSRQAIQGEPMQSALWGSTELFHTVVISHRKDFETLFEGFNRLRAISYVVSPDMLLEFLNKRGYNELEVVVGENLAGANLSDHFRQTLAQKKREVTEGLAAQVEKGKLRIFVPAVTIHTKLYILERSEESRVIITSANLTETARQATRQVNYAW